MSRTLLHRASPSTPGSRMPYDGNSLSARARCGQGGEAVSYTHLDVYKRQVTLLPTDKYTAVGRNNRQGRDKDWLKTKLATLTPHERKIFMRKREDARLAGIDARLRHGKSIAARAMPRLDELGDIVH